MRSYGPYGGKGLRVLLESLHHWLKCFVYLFKWSLVKMLILVVSLRIAKWVLIRKEVVGFNMIYILFNSEACMSCGGRKKRFVSWCPDAIWGVEV